MRIDEFRIREIDLPSGRVLDAPPDETLDLGRRQRKALVGTACRNAERTRLRQGFGGQAVDHAGDDGVEIGRRMSRVREIADAGESR